MAIGIANTTLLRIVCIARFQEFPLRLTRSYSKGELQSLSRCFGQPHISNHDDFTTVANLNIDWPKGQLETQAWPHDFPVKKCIDYNFIRLKTLGKCPPISSNKPL